jgi:L-lactate dehydrogenase
LTYIVHTIPGLENSTVIGSGTQLDSKRLWSELLHQGILVSEASKTFVVGEHGDSSVSLFSQLNSDYRPDEAKQEVIAEAVRNAAYKIIAGKKATYFGIAATTAEIVQEMVEKSGKTLALSVVPQGEYGLKDLAISLPCRITENGLEVAELSISDEENSALQKSAEIIRNAMQELSL